MDGQPQQDPPLTYSDPQAYILWLKTQRVPAQQIVQMVQERFGPGKSPEQRAKEQADAQAKAGMIGTAGQVAGTIGGAYAAGQIANMFGAGAGAGTGAATGAATTGVGAAGGTAAGGAGAGAATGAGTTAGTSTLGSIGSVALPVAAAAAVLSNAWETGMKDILRGRGDRADWTNQALNLTLPGTVANIGLRLMGKRSLGAMMKSGKSNAQAMRDDFRGMLKQTGVADNNYHVTLADGSKFNIGLDGKTKYENADGTKRNAWDVDWTNPVAKFASSQIDPMIKNIYGPDAQKAGIRPEQYTGMLVNAVTSNAKNEADVRKNIEAILGKSTFGKQTGVAPTGPTMPVQRPAKGEVMRVSPGMYMNDKGHVGPAKTVRDALRANYNKGK